MNTWGDSFLMKRFFFSLASLQLKKEESPATPEAKAIAEIEKSGGAVRTIAQNDDRLDVSFQLQGGSITDKDLAPMGRLSKVTNLNLARTGITDAALGEVTRHTGLVQLHLEGTKITDAGLARLKPLQNLEYLNLYGTPVTDEGVKHLSGLTKLKNLYLWQTKVTPAGVAKLKEALPKTDINLGWDAKP